MVFIFRKFLSSARNFNWISDTITWLGSKNWNSSARPYLLQLCNCVGALLICRNQEWGISLTL